jgi:hypothetical protein
MELDHAILADVASQRPDGKLDLHGVGWDTIYAAAVPASHPRMDLVVRFLLSAQETEHEHNVVITLVTADGGELARIQGTIAPLPEVQRAAIPAGRRVGIGMNITLASVAFPHYGAYNVVITWDGNEARQPMRIFVEPIPAQPQQPQPPFV